MLESNNQDVVKEIKQLIYEQYDEGKLDRFWLKNTIFLALFLVPDGSQSV